MFMRFLSTLIKYSLNYINQTLDEACNNQNMECVLPLNFNYLPQNVLSMPTNEDNGQFLPE